MGNFMPAPGEPVPSPEDVPTPVEVDAAEETAVAPAPVTPGQKVSRTYTHRGLAQAVDQFEKDLGGRDKLLGILAGLPADDRLAETLGLLADPRSDDIPLSRLCQVGGITMGELMEAVRKGVLGPALTRALMTMAARIQPIVEDVMRRAAPYEEPCEACDGGGTRARKEDEPPVPCQVCKGAGKKMVMPELERQKFALELARLLPKKGVDTVVMGAGSIANLGSGTVQSMNALLKEMDRLPARPRSVGRGTVGGNGTVVVESPVDVAGDGAHPPSD